MNAYVILYIPHPILSAVVYMHPLSHLGAHLQLVTGHLKGKIAILPLGIQCS